MQSTTTAEAFKKATFLILQQQKNTIFLSIIVVIFLSKFLKATKRGTTKTIYNDFIYIYIGKRFGSI
jgi:hypothetical protein